MLKFFEKGSDNVGNILQKFKHLIPRERSADNHQQTNEGGRDWENMYRDRWSFDKCVRSTHGVNCTGSCSWNIYVKNGLVAWGEFLLVLVQPAQDKISVFARRACGVVA